MKPEGALGSLLEAHTRHRSALERATLQNPPNVLHGVLGTPRGNVDGQRDLEEFGVHGFIMAFLGIEVNQIVLVYGPTDRLRRAHQSGSRWTATRYSHRENTYDKVREAYNAEFQANSQAQYRLEYPLARGPTS